MPCALTPGSRGCRNGKPKAVMALLDLAKAQQVALHQVNNGDGKAPRQVAANDFTRLHFVLFFHPESGARQLAELRKQLGLPETEVQPEAPQDQDQDQDQEQEKAKETEKEKEKEKEKQQEQEKETEQEQGQEQGQGQAVEQHAALAATVEVVRPERPGSPLMLPRAGSPTQAGDTLVEVTLSRCPHTGEVGIVFGLGPCIAGVRDPVITDITANTPAAMSGKLQIDDILAEVQGRDVWGLAWVQVQELLSASGSIQLTFIRPGLKAAA